MDLDRVDIATADRSTWTPQPDAAALAERAVQDAVDRSARLRELAATLAQRTSTRLVDWVDHVETMVVTTVELGSVGYEPGRDGLWRHPGAQLPAVVASDRAVVALRVDDVDAFAAVHGGEVAGSPLGRLRSVWSWDDGGVSLGAMERRSWTAGRTPEVVDQALIEHRRRAAAAWLDRPRTASDLPGAVDLARRTADDVGPDLAGSYAMAAERSYWQRRNRTARLQHGRQRQLGLGWGNHDHHTFRSSRSSFAPLVACLEAAGFTPRERFHAGAEAGWGAQVLDNADAGLVVFADVDLRPHEHDVDFAHAGLDELEMLGPVGTWCALHGESILEAGMHHLAAQFLFDELHAALADVGVEHNAPFSDFPHLRQAFTSAEVWPVTARRVDDLERQGTLTAEHAARYRADGAPGSHLENVARRDGFKGFNQHSVSQTIRDTDLRASAP